MTVFFFMDPVWKPYMDELGMTCAVENLKRRGYRYEWVMKVFGPEDGASYHPKGGAFHKSKCPHYEGWWWAGGFGAVQCGAVPELLPGFVFDSTCQCRHEECPFYKIKEEKKCPNT